MGAYAIILIPDISGFTDFLTKTETTHGSLAIILPDHMVVKKYPACFLFLAQDAAFLTFLRLRLQEKPGYNNPLITY